jgi:hypothetical protein
MPPEKRFLSISSFPQLQICLPARWFRSTLGVLTITLLILTYVHNTFANLSTLPMSPKESSGKVQSILGTFHIAVYLKIFADHFCQNLPLISSSHSTTRTMSLLQISQTSPTSCLRCHYLIETRLLCNGMHLTAKACRSGTSAAS